MASGIAALLVNSNRAAHAACKEVGQNCDKDGDCVDFATQEGLPRPETWHCLTCSGSGCAQGTACAASCSNPA